MNRRILVVDNEPVVRELLTDLLVRFGYEVEGAQSGCDALKRLDEAKFDAVLLDIHLQDLDGKKIYLSLREHSSDLAGRVIFVTGDVANDETISFIRETGNLSLHKPFTLIELREVLERFFQCK